VKANDRGARRNTVSIRAEQTAYRRHRPADCTR